MHSGILGISLDIFWDKSKLEIVDTGFSNYDFSKIITPNFPAFRSGFLNSYLGNIDALGAKSFGGRPIGNGIYERFAIIKLKALPIFAPANGTKTYIDLVQNSATILNPVKDAKNVVLKFAEITIAPKTQKSWHNSANPYDVNADGYVSAMDALNVINEINISGSRPLTGNNTTSSYLDVNNDKFLSASDVLAVINYLNQR